jgi:hypothetical protein
MTPYTPFVVTNFSDGIRTDTESFLIPDDATPQMLNMTHFRGRIVEKGGNSLLCNPSNIGEYFRGRLGVRNPTGTTTNVAGQAVIPAGTLIQAGPLDPGTVRITVGSLTVIDNAIDGTFEVYTGGPATVTGQINYSTGIISTAVTGFGAYGGSTNSWSALVILTPSSISPVMGADNIDVTGSTSENMMAFDTVKPYIFNVSVDQFQIADKYDSTSADRPVVTFSGSDSDFFWCLNYADTFWVTNNTPGFQALYPINVVVGATTTITFPASTTFAVNDWVFLWDLGNITITQASDIIQAYGQVTAVSTTTFANDTITVNIATSYTDGASTFSGGGTVQAINRQLNTSGDGIKYYSVSGWHNFAPPLTGVYNTPNGGGGQATYLFGARFIVSYKGYLLFFNTVEGKNLASAQHYQNRMRRSAAGTPYYSQPLPSTQGTNANSFSQFPGFGGFYTSPVNQDMVSARFCRDELIVSHETHDLRLDFTGNIALLFTWARVNDEFGAESTFSMINADTKAVKISQDGFTESQGIDTVKMDMKVPDLVYRLSNTDDGKKRVHGYRNFVSQLFKWTAVIPQGYPSYLKFPNVEVVYNYALKSWSLNKTYNTVYNSFKLFYDNTWSNAKRTWAASPMPWNTLQSRNGEQISVVGNSQGFFHKTEETQITSQAYNDRGYRITDITSFFLTVPNHSFKNGDYVYMTLMKAPNAAFNNAVYQVQFATVNGFNLVNQAGNVIQFTNSSATSPPSGFLAVVDNIEYWTKKFYVGGNAGLQTRLGYVDVFFESQDVASEMSVDVYLDDNNEPSFTKVFSLEKPVSGNSGKIIRRVYINAMAQAVQLRLYYSNAQMFDYNTGYKQFILHGYTIYIKQSGRIVNYSAV